MDTSIFLARLIGPVMLAVGASMLINRENALAMAEDFLEHRGLIFLAGIITLVTGLAIVLTHNVWEASWPVIITIIGWLCIFGGIFRMAFPDSVQAIGRSMLEKPGALLASGIGQIVFGLWLSWLGYTS